MKPKIRYFIGGIFALLLLPLTVSAEYINVYPGPDEEWNYLYDYGDVEVGQSGVMIFQIENDPAADSYLTLEPVFLEDAPAFSITEQPSYPAYVAPGDSIYVEVTFTPGAEGLAEGVMRIITNASNIPPGGNIPYALRGVGIEGTPDPLQLMNEAIDFYDEQINIGQIVGLGPGNSGNSKERIFGKMLDDISVLIEAGDYNEACRSLNKAILRIDGQSQPRDMLAGPALDTLHAMLLSVINALGC